MRKLRRVVTGHNSAGRSRLLFDGPPTSVVLDRLAELWVTDVSPADNGSAVDAAQIRVPAMQPPPGGTVFRYIEVPPENNLESSKVRAIETRRVLGSEDIVIDTARHPTMHRTHTIDYVVLLTGQVTMLLDEGEVDLAPFDLVVQRGTNHAWVNRGAEPALLLATCVDARPVMQVD